MIDIVLPDGSVRQYDAPVTGAAIALGISRSLAKKAIAVKIDGRLSDIFTPVETDAAVEIITRDHEDALELIRHDTAHLLAQAVQELFPGTRIAIGPNVADGFYYDFESAKPFSESDFALIEKRMSEIVDEARPTRKEVWTRQKAIEYFTDAGEHYKVELVRAFPENEPVSIYYHGDWADLCRGPHLPDTKHIGKAFKLMKVAGAYWRGDHRNAMLQRIYGTAWSGTKDLQAYLVRLEEAGRRDHRKLGREMDLFHFQPEAQGSVFWHPAGQILWRELEAYMRRQLEKDEYREVKTPQLLNSVFWEQSGHWEKFRENMFVVPDVVPSTEKDGPVLPGITGPEPGDLLALKPMNCPAHVQIFRQTVKSYRDLPVRMAEFGCCHRNEPHGALHGLMRVRQMTQDDGHIFCTDDQVTGETKRFLSLFNRVYTDMGLTDIAYRLATRPEKRAGDDATWDRAEHALASALKQAGLDFDIAEGEGAFYGPKLEFHLTDAIGRTWQAGTYQLDYVLPGRLDASYVDSSGDRRRPVILHRAVFGTFERFIGLLIEHYAGKLPFWLAPVQVVVATITSKSDAYAQETVSMLKKAGIRAVADTRNEKISYKIREHFHSKTPLVAVAGERETAGNTLSMRYLGKKNLETVTRADAVSLLEQEARAPDMRQG